jgi:hypothetical protein
MIDDYVEFIDKTKNFRLNIDFGILLSRLRWTRQGRAARGRWRWLGSHSSNVSR